MIITTQHAYHAGKIAEFLVHKGAGFRVLPREIFETSPRIETGDDVREALVEFCRNIEVEFHEGGADG